MNDRGRKVWTQTVLHTVQSGADEGTGSLEAAGTVNAPRCTLLHCPNSADPQEELCSLIGRRCDLDS
jgi:hypothetical protein